MKYLIIKSEIWRIGLILLVALTLASLTGLWTEVFLLATLFYLWFVFYQLQKIYDWLKVESKKGQSLNADGAFELLGYQIQNYNKAKLAKKDRIGDFYARFQKIVRNLPYATVLINQTNEIEWINESAEVLLGLDRNQDVGQRIENLFREPKLQTILKKESHHELEINSPVSIKVKLAIQLIVISENLKVLIARDITEYAHLQEMRKSFISNASHELRTPLTVISGYLEMLKIDKNLPSSYSKIIKASFEQSIRMKNIVEGLLTLSRLEGSELDGVEASEKIELHHLLTRIINDQEILQNRKIIREIDRSIGIIGSEVEIISMCNNLIHNALVHNPKATEIKVIWQKKSGNLAEFIVRDNGVGIAEKHLPHLTERFYRIKKEDDSSFGTGLGLAITKLIATRHGCKFKIKSALNQGSEFKITFPKNRVYSISKV